jgi:hypothetical protein
MEKQYVRSDFPTDMPHRLRGLATAVRRLGNPYRRNPEELITDRERIEKSLHAMATEIEARG